MSILDPVGSDDMSVRKTKLDIDRERYAEKVNASITVLGLSVIGGGSKGPYTIIMGRLRRRDLRRCIRALERVFACEDRDLSPRVEMGTSRPERSQVDLEGTE